MHNVSQCSNSCQPHPQGDHFKVTLLEVAIFNNLTGVMKALELGKLRLKESPKPPFFILEAL